MQTIDIAAEMAKIPKDMETLEDQAAWERYARDWMIEFNRPYEELESEI